MNMFQKRGQVAAGAAVLLAIIAGTLLLFILFLPPEDRQVILGPGVTPSDDTIGGKVLVKNLLTESPGRIDFLGQTDIEHPLPVVNIYTRTEPRILGEKHTVLAKKGVFSEETGSFNFVVPDLRNTENILLSFKVTDITGNLILSLNGDEIYNVKSSAGASQTITLPKNSLRDENILTLASSSPGLAFWKTNRLAMESIKVVADVTSLEAQSSKNIFLISETEKSNLEKVNLRFEPTCEFETVGKLTITVNARQIYNAVPDCDLAFVPIEFSPDLVSQGENEIVFKTDRGAYQLSHVNIRSKLKEVDFPTYYFDLSFEEFRDIRNGAQRLRLSMDFVDVVTRKIGDLVFNGHLARFDIKEVSYVVDIGEDAVKGNNALKIKPKKTLEIRELKVDLVQS
jgi:hypothetical protein